MPALDVRACSLVRSRIVARGLLQLLLHACHRPAHGTNGATQGFPLPLAQETYLIAWLCPKPRYEVHEGQGVILPKLSYKLPSDRLRRKKDSIDCTYPFTIHAEPGSGATLSTLQTQLDHKDQSDAGQALTHQQLHLSRQGAGC